MASYKVTSDNELAGVGQGGTITDAQLEGWDVPHLVKTGILEEISGTTPTKKEKE
jgi:hypothetical protein